MDAKQIDEALRDVLDSALIHVGYADYMPDFQMYFYVGPGCTMKYRFINCVVADSATALSPEVWKGSLDEQLIGDLEAPPIQVRLIFSDLVVEQATPGENPFTVDPPQESP